MANVNPNVCMKALIPIPEVNKTKEDTIQTKMIL